MTSPCHGSFSLDISHSNTSDKGMDSKDVAEVFRLSRASHISVLFGIV